MSHLAMSGCTLVQSLWLGQCVWEWGVFGCLNSSHPGLTAARHWVSEGLLSSLQGSEDNEFHVYFDFQHDSQITPTHLRLLLKMDGWVGFLLHLHDFSIHIYSLPSARIVLTIAEVEFRVSPMMIKSCDVMIPLAPPPNSGLTPRKKVMIPVTRHNARCNHNNNIEMKLT